MKDPTKRKEGKKMATFTNYNELMHKALMISRERGVTEQKDLDAIIVEVFQADRRERNKEE